MKNVIKSFLAGVLFLLSFSFSSSAGQLLDPQKTYDLNLSMKSPSVTEFTTAVTQKIGVLFSFDSSISGEVMNNVSIAANGKPLQDIMQEIFDAQPAFSFEIVSNSVLVFKKAPAPQVEQKSLIQGVVKDDSGLPLMGAGILVKGTDRGTVSDMDGRYELEAKAGEVLVFTSLGYSDQEVKVGSSSVIDVQMATDVNLLEEVVVVGYGTQKKVNLTGAVAVVSSKDMAARPVSNMSNALQGMLPGVTVVSPSGQPGSSSTSIRIRGVGTIGNANPLVLIDGVEGDFSALNPEDIESVSVLKDAASSAIYGARAANGVLLVTTKNASAQGVKNRVTLGAYVGFQNPTRLPEMCNALEYMQLENEAKRNVGSPISWQQEQIDKVLDGSDPNNFSDTDWVGSVIRKFALQQNYNLGVSGSIGNTGYLASYRYLDQDGLTAGNTTGEKRHNIRLKLNSKWFDRLTLNSNIGYISSKVNEPLNGLSSGRGALYQAMRIAPFAPLYYTDKSWGYGGGNTNPVALLHDGGWSKRHNEEFSIQEMLKVDILKGWNVSATYNMTSRNGFRESLVKTLKFINPDDGEIKKVVGEPNSLSNADTRSVQQTFIVQTNFDFTFGKHNINGVLGMSQEWYEYKHFSASRQKLISESNPSLNLGDPSLMSNDASARSWAIRSGFGRLCYNYGDRYLLEANLRYDLSSRFEKSRRGGWFPSVSGAWRLSEEPFMKQTRTIISNLKFRVSWGMLGNQYVGSSDFPYLSVLDSFSKDLSLIGSNPTSAYVQTILPNPDLTWEKIQMFDVGIDLSLFNSRFNLTFDWYNKDTRDILLQLNYPDQLGAKPAEENAGRVNNQGWEIDLSWKDQVGDFYYGIGFNLSDVKNKIVDLAGKAPDLGGYQIRRVGDPIDAFYGYIADGLMMPEDFRLYDETAGVYIKPEIPVVIGNTYQPGDIKYRDISGPKGKPDGRITPEYDRVVIGSNIPRYTYSIRGNLAWKGLDFSILFQGVGKCDGYLRGSARHAFQDMAGYPQKVHLDRFHIDTNPDPHALYPRLTYNMDFNQSTFSTYWLEDASYFRLKNVQIGYTFPEKWMKKARISNLRVYLSGDNLFTLSKFFYAYDPETPVSKGGYYPQIRTVVFGINLSFE